MKTLEIILQEIREDMTEVLEMIPDSVYKTGISDKMFIGQTIRKHHIMRMNVLDPILPEYAPFEKLKESFDGAENFQINEDEEPSPPEVISELPIDIERLSENLYQIYFNRIIWMEFLKRTRNLTRLKKKVYISFYDLETLVIEHAELLNTFTKNEKLMDILISYYENVSGKTSEEEINILYELVEDLAKVDRSFQMGAPYFLQLCGQHSENKKIKFKMYERALHFNRQNPTNGLTYYLNKSQIIFNYAETLREGDKRIKGLYEQALLPLQKAEEMIYYPEIYTSTEQKKNIYQNLSKIFIALSTVTEGDEQLTFLANADYFCKMSLYFGEDHEDSLNNGLVYRELYYIESFSEEKRRKFGEICVRELNKYISRTGDFQMNIVDTIRDITDDEDDDDEGEDWKYC